MNLKSCFKWIHTKATNYNLFMLEENNYDDNDDLNDPTVVLKKQKYKTRLYSVLVIGQYDREIFFSFLYCIFYSLF